MPSLSPGTCRRGSMARAEPGSISEIGQCAQVATSFPLRCCARAASAGVAVVLLGTCLLIASRPSDLLVDRVAVMTCASDSFANRPMATWLWFRLANPSPQGFEGDCPPARGRIQEEPAPCNGWCSNRLRGPRRCLRLDMSFTVGREVGFRDVAIRHVEGANAGPYAGRVGVACTNLRTMSRGSDRP